MPDTKRDATKLNYYSLCTEDAPKYTKLYFLARWGGVWHDNALHRCTHWDIVSIHFNLLTLGSFLLFSVFLSSGYFVELFNRSAISLHESFTSTWGALYAQNSHVFSDLYTDLRHYYRGSNVNLEEVLNEFWARLLERLFSQANKPSFIGKAHTS